jgi:hypothetical protein
MPRSFFAIATVALALTAFSGVSRATPIAPFPEGVASEAGSGDVTKVWRGGYGWRGYGYGYPYAYGYYGYPYAYGYPGYPYGYGHPY